MQQNYKKILPWALVVIILAVLLWPKKESKIESTIDYQLRVEESLVDSFLSTRELIILERDSSLQRVDTIGVESLLSILRKNITWYENKNVIPWTISRDSTRIVTE